MKKLFALLLAASMVLALAGCALLPVLRYEFMEVDEMLKLPDDELIVALMMQLGDAEFATLTEAQKVVYTAAALELEVLNGGLVQFLSNEGSYAAPYVLEALEKIGATEHHALLQDVLSQNGVNLAELSGFVTDDLDAFSALYDRFDFDSFDSAYEDLPSMTDYIRTYIQAHADDF